MAAVGLIIQIAGVTCVEKQIGALKRIQVLHDTIGEEIPIQVFLMTHSDTEGTIMRTLLLRKALCPTYELWYTNAVNPLSSTILSGQLEPVLDPYLGLHSGEAFEISGTRVRMETGRCLVLFWISRERLIEIGIDVFFLWIF